MNSLDETDDGRVVAALKDYMRLLDEGKAPSPEVFLQQHMAIADELRPALEGLALVHRAGEPKMSTMVAPDADFTALPIGDFKIVGELGRGGMGVVYEAIQLSLGRHVALKVLPFASGLDEVRLQRFRNEAHAAAALHHTNIVPVYAVGSDRGVHYYAMQMIDGSTLADLIDNMQSANSTDGRKRSRTGNDTIDRHSTILNDSLSGRQRYYQSVVRMAHQAAIAIQHAHQYGVVHRDIKPANLLLDSVGKIWVTDFGLAQVQNEASLLTFTGDPMGTLRYMSPEQAAGNRNELDHRTDIYSLGVTLYELLTLQPAIQGNAYREMLNNVALHEPPSPKAVDPFLPIELDTIVRKSIAKVPSERYASAGAFADDLQAWLDDKPIAAKPPSVLERVAKWRRRNSGVVTVASGFLLLASLGLLATTLMIWEEQQHTREALQRETQQRQVAQRSFQQAREAVETFSRLSESELAYRPDLQDLRRNFLETSLAFYQDFLADRADDPALAQELENTSARVEKMVEELRVLDSISPLRALADSGVRDELSIEPATAQSIQTAIDSFNQQRQVLADQYVDGLSSENSEMIELARDFSSFITEQLSEAQMSRLRQIVRQEQLPFTFKSSEVVAALQLSREQREDISRIIVETRPGRDDGPRGDGPRPEGPRPEGPRGERGEGPGRGGPPRFGGPHFEGPGFEGPGFDGPHFGGPGFDHQPGGRPDPPRGDGRRGGGPDGPNDWRFDPSRSAVTANTVKQILKVLTPEQKVKWQELVGEPFRPPMLSP